MWVTEFEAAVDRVLRSLQPGDVVTYGEVATEAGYPGRARAVGTILARSDGQYPWWRVVASGGRLVPGHEREHRRRLKAEGVEVDERGVRALRGSGGRAGGRASEEAGARRSGPRPGSRPRR